MREVRLTKKEPDTGSAGAERRRAGLEEAIARTRLGLSGRRQDQNAGRTH